MNSYQYSLFDDASRKLKEEQQQQTEQGVELQEESTETKDPKQFGFKDNIKRSWGRHRWWWCRYL